MTEKQRVNGSVMERDSHCYSTCNLLAKTGTLFSRCHCPKGHYNETEACEKITHQSPASIWSLYSSCGLQSPHQPEQLCQDHINTWYGSSALMGALIGTSKEIQSNGKEYIHVFKKNSMYIVHTQTHIYIHHPIY